MDVVEKQPKSFDKFCEEDLGIDLDSPIGKAITKYSVSIEEGKIATLLDEVVESLEVDCLRGDFLAVKDSFLAVKTSIIAWPTLPISVYMTALAITKPWEHALEIERKELYTVLFQRIKRERSEDEAYQLLCGLL